MALENNDEKPRVEPASKTNVSPHLSAGDSGIGARGDKPGALPEHVQSMQQECEAHRPKDTSEAKRELHQQIDARKAGQSTYTSLMLGGRVELTDGDQTLVKGFRNTDLNTSASTQPSEVAGSNILPVAQSERIPLAQGTIDSGIKLPAINDIFATPTTNVEQSVPPVDASAKLATPAEASLYGDRTDKGGEHAAGGRQELVMPTVEQMKTLPIDQLVKALHANQEVIHDFLAANHDKLPAVIAFHGGTKESNDLWIGTKGKELVPPGAKSGNQENVTWAELVHTATHDFRQLATDIGHAVNVAAGFADPTWIKEKYTPGGVSVIDMSGNMMDGKLIGVRERETHFGGVEKGIIDAGRNFDNKYKGTIDIGNWNQYEKMPTTPDGRNVIASEFLKQQMVMDTVALITGQAPTGSGPAERTENPRGAAPVETESPYKLAVMPDSATQHDPPGLAKDVWNKYVGQMPENIQKITDWNQLRELLVAQFRGENPASGNQRSDGAQTPGSGELQPVGGPQAESQKVIQIVPAPRESQIGPQKEIQIVPAPGETQIEPQKEIQIVPPPVGIPIEPQGEIQIVLPPGGTPIEPKKEPPGLAKEFWDNFVKQLPENIQKITNWDKLRELLVDEWRGTHSSDKGSGNSGSGSGTGGGSEGSGNSGADSGVGGGVGPGARRGIPAEGIKPQPEAPAPKPEQPAPRIEVPPPDQTHKPGQLGEGWGTPEVRLRLPARPQPEAPAPKPEQPAPKPEHAPKPEQPAPHIGDLPIHLKPRVPHPDSPAPKPEQPAPKPEQHAPHTGDLRIRLNPRVTHPDSPAPKPEQPAPKPEQPAPHTGDLRIRLNPRVTHPDSPAPKPEQPAPKPEQPAPHTGDLRIRLNPRVTHPDSPAPKPEQPAPKPEQPAPKPEQPAPHTGALRIRLNPQVPHPDSPGAKPEQPAPKPEQPAPHTDAPRNYLKPRVPQPEAPAPKPEQPQPKPDHPPVRPRIEGSPPNLGVKPGHSVRDGSPPSLGVTPGHSVRDGSPPNLGVKPGHSVRDGSPPSLGVTPGHSVRDGSPPNLGVKPGHSVRDGSPPNLGVKPGQSERDSSPPNLRVKPGQSERDSSPPNLGVKPGQSERDSSPPNTPARPGEAPPMQQPSRPRGEAPAMQQPGRPPGEAPAMQQPGRPGSEGQPMQKPEIDRHAAWEKMTGWDLSGSWKQFKEMTESELRKTVNQKIDSIQRAQGNFQHFQEWINFKHDLVKAGLIHSEQNLPESEKPKVPVKVKGPPPLTR